EMARPGLPSRLRLALRQALREERRTSTGPLRMKGEATSVRVTVQPMEVPRFEERLLLVIFEEVPALQRASAAPAEAEEALERELEATRLELSSTIELLESTNQELTAAHEEAVSMNEELQSANEELEASREELQSLNEELTNVNRQLEE